MTDLIQTLQAIRDEKRSEEKMSPDEVAQWDKHVANCLRLGVPTVAVDEWMPRFMKMSER